MGPFDVLPADGMPMSTPRVTCPNMSLVDFAAWEGNLFTMMLGAYPATRGELAEQRAGHAPAAGRCTHKAAAGRLAACLFSRARAFLERADVLTVILEDGLDTAAYARVSEWVGGGAPVCAPPAEKVNENLHAPLSDQRDARALRAVLAWDLALYYYAVARVHPSAWRDARAHEHAQGALEGEGVDFVDASKSPEQPWKSPERLWKGPWTAADERFWTGRAQTYGQISSSRVKRGDFSVLWHCGERRNATTRSFREYIHGDIREQQTQEAVQAGSKKRKKTGS